MPRPTPSGQLWNALIKTHHITSRKKVAKLRQAAENHDVYALICYGGPPGIMYTEGREDGVKEWVECVHRLRYKDYQLAVRPEPLVLESPAQRKSPSESPGGEGAVPVGLFEVGSVKEFGAIMRERGVWTWWRKGMGYVQD